MSRVEYEHDQCIVIDIADDSVVGNLARSSGLPGGLPGGRWEIVRLGDPEFCSVSNDGRSVALSLRLWSYQQDDYDERTLFAEFYLFDEDVDPDPITNAKYTQRYKFPLTNVSLRWDGPNPTISAGAFFLRYYNDGNGIMYESHSNPTADIKPMFIVFDKACGLEIETEIPDPGSP